MSEDEALLHALQASMGVEDEGALLAKALEASMQPPAAPPPAYDPADLAATPAAATQGELEGPGAEAEELGGSEVCSRSFVLSNAAILGSAEASLSLLSASLASSSILCFFMCASSSRSFASLFFFGQSLLASISLETRLHSFTFHELLPRLLVFPL